ncbi:MAG TPA: sigma-70 family RNA polymerase sigma factor, partial [Euzebya sp.]|nr:sigma-70 family RNA polymerase sigma factor [Euzebya sp.]
EDSALVAFCTDLHPRLLGALVLSTGDPEAAEDLAQEALCRVVERWPSVRGMDSPEGWAFRVAFNLSHSWWRRSASASRAVLRLRAQAPSGVLEPDLTTCDWVRAAVTALPPRQRQVIALRYYADLSVSQTADVMGCAEGTVKSLTSKATTTLVRALGSVEGPPPSAATTRRRR